MVEDSNSLIVLGGGGKEYPFDRRLLLVQNEGARSFYCTSESPEEAAPPTREGLTWWPPVAREGF